MRRPDIEPIHKRRLRANAARQKRIAAENQLAALKAQIQATKDEFTSRLNNWNEGRRQMFNAGLGQEQGQQFVNWPQSWGARCPGNTAATTCICGCCPKS